MCLNTVDRTIYNSVPVPIQDKLGDWKRENGGDDEGGGTLYWQPNELASS